MQVNEDKNSNYLFTSCTINWTVENFCFAYPLNNYSILSPVFLMQGLKSVYWRLSLDFEDRISPEITDHEMSPEEDTEIPPEKTDTEIPPEKTDTEIPPEKTDTEMPPENNDARILSRNGLVSVYLEILPTSLVKNVFGNWEMTLTVGTKKFGPYEMKNDFLEHSKNGHIGITTTDEIFAEYLLLLKPDTISIRLELIAFDKDRFSIPEDDKPPGMNRLYEDWKNFKDVEKNYSDIKLKVKDKYIKAHKIVLSCNERFDIYIKHAVNDVVEISDFDYETLNAFVNFLYSREIRSCLKDLSLSMIRCLKHFNCDALKSYYVPEEIPLKTKIQSVKQEFQWYVADILDKNEFEIRSPPIKFLDSSALWFLTISMNANDPNRYISIFAANVAGERPIHFSLEFALVDKNEREHFARRLVRHNENYQNLGFREFIKKSTLREHQYVAIGDCVNFMLRIRTSNGSQEYSMGCHMMSFTLTSEFKSHKQVSEKMLEFYENGIFSDITIFCKSDSNRANKFILAARSPGFRDTIENNENIITTCKVKPYLLRRILKYMYTGILDDISEVILELLEFSSPAELHIPSLHEECQNYLRGRSACY